MDKETRNLLNLGALKCCLSGLTITDQKDYSVEHLVPKARTNESLAGHPYNLHPALKILNQIKGSLLPCEWNVCKIERCYRALKHYKLKPREKQIVQAAIKVYESEQPRNPCDMCILNFAKYYCEEARTR